MSKYIPGLPKPRKCMSCWNGEAVGYRMSANGKYRIYRCAECLRRKEEHEREIAQRLAETRRAA